MNKKVFLYLVCTSFVPFVSFAETTTSDNPVLVKVNGVAITQNEVQHFILKQAKAIPVQSALQEMINVELLSQAAKNDNFLKDQSLALEIKRTASALIASSYLQKHLRELDISEPDLQARYKKDYQDSSSSMEYNANHILVKTEAEALDIINKLDNKADFNELAKSTSIGPSGKDGGALGWFKKTDMVAPFSQATMQLSSGEYSKHPVKTRFGWHLIFLNDTRSTEPPPFESVRKKLTTAIAAESISARIKALHDAAHIEIISPK